MYSIKSVQSSGQKDKLLKAKMPGAIFFIQPSSPSWLPTQISISSKSDIRFADIPMFATAELNQIPSSLGPE